MLIVAAGVHGRRQCKPLSILVHIDTRDGTGPFASRIGACEFYSGKRAEYPRIERERAPAQFFGRLALGPFGVEKDELLTNPAHFGTFNVLDLHGPSRERLDHRSTPESADQFSVHLDGAKACGVTAEMGDLDCRVERHRLLASPLIRLHAAVQVPFIGLTGKFFFRRLP